MIKQSLLLECDCRVPGTVSSYYFCVCCTVQYLLALGSCSRHIVQYHLPVLYRYNIHLLHSLFVLKKEVGTNLTAGMLSAIQLVFIGNALCTIASRLQKEKVSILLEWGYRMMVLVIVL